MTLSFIGMGKWIKSSVSGLKRALAELFSKCTIITRTEQNYGRVTAGGTLPFVHFRIRSRCRTAGCQGISFSSSSWVGDLPR